MARLLANENVPAAVVTSLRNAGHDAIWIHEIGPGQSDEEVLALGLSEARVLLTFDRDFGELAFHQGATATAGVILLRPRLRSPDYLIRFTLAVLSQDHTWEGPFAVAEEGRIRIVPLPA